MSFMWVYLISTLVVKSCTHQMCPIVFYFFSLSEEVVVLQLQDSAQPSQCYSEMVTSTQILQI